MKTTERFYQTCLKDELSERLKQNPRYSLRAFAKFLALDPSTLSRMLNGQKRPTPELSKKIVAKLELDPKEAKKFLLSMAEAYEADGVKRKKAEVKEILKKPRQKIPEKDLTPDIFRYISEWYHYAILQLMQEDHFKFDTRWIARELGILEMEAKLAIERMVELEIIAVEGKKLVRTSERLTSGDLTVTTQALRKRIKQITDKSVHSLENDPIHLRNHTTMTMAIDPEQLPIAKEMIQEFMDKLSDVLQVKKTNVYELQINLFPLQRTTK